REPSPAQQPYAPATYVDCEQDNNQEACSQQNSQPDTCRLPLWQDLGRWSGYFSCLEVPLESSQVSSDVRGMLVPQVEVFFQRLVDQRFDFRRNVRIELRCGYWR